MKHLYQKLRSTLKSSSKKDIVNVVENLPEWYMPAMSRGETESYLINKEIGVFVVRKSESKSNCFVLSVKVAKFLNAAEVSHYLILQASTTGTFKLDGFCKEFSDLRSLATHCSVIRDMLPVLLNLKYYRQGYVQQISRDNNDNYMFYSSSSTSSLVSMNSLSSFTSNVSN